MITTGVPDKLRSDEGWLFMMLINLASNSIKHTPMGTVTLCASTAGDSRLRLEVRAMTPSTNRARASARSAIRYCSHPERSIGHGR
eukprot:4112135-Pleurochrysis_carterae.AAC.3